MNSFFNFDILIAIDALKIFYIIGTFVLPIMSWYFLLWILNKYRALFRFYNGMKSSILISILVWFLSKIKFFKKYVDKTITWNSLEFSQKIKFVFLFIFIVFFSELFYRLLFEYLIAFIQMRDALVLYNTQ